MAKVELRVVGDDGAGGEEPKRRSIRRDPPPIDPALIDTDDVIHLRLAEEIDYIRRMMDALGNELSADSAVVVRHFGCLQSIDIIEQMLGHLAAVIRSSAPERAVERIGMADLKARLKRRPLL